MGTHEQKKNENSWTSGKSFQKFMSHVYWVTIYSTYVAPSTHTQCPRPRATENKCQNMQTLEFTIMNITLLVEFRSTYRMHVPNIVRQWHAQCPVPLRDTPDRQSDHFTTLTVSVPFPCVHTMHTGTSHNKSVAVVGRQTKRQLKCHSCDRQPSMMPPTWARFSGNTEASMQTMLGTARANAEEMERTRVCYVFSLRLTRLVATRERANGCDVTCCVALVIRSIEGTLFAFNRWLQQPVSMLSVSTNIPSNAWWMWKFDWNEFHLDAFERIRR